MERLLEDRRQCYRRRDAFPRRPTEVCPFGVVDVEIALTFPEAAAFRFAGEFSPSDEESLTDAMVAYHLSYDYACTPLPTGIGRVCPVPPSERLGPDDEP